MDLKIERSSSHIDIISKLLHSRSQAHVFHFQSVSYSRHKALEDYYTAIVDKIDEYVETTQGKFSTLLKGYKTYPYVEDGSEIKYFEGLKSDLEIYRSTQLNKKELANLDNQIQTIQDLVEQTIYKLKFLV